MRAIIVPGGKCAASELRIGDVAPPDVSPGELLVAVKAAGVNRPDIVQRNGLYPPPPGASDVLGLEIAGIVERGAGRWREGDEVCALLGGGGYAEYAVVDPRHALPIPKRLDLIEAAGLPEVTFTVFANLFEHGGLSKGDTLLVHGATSGIGTMAIQIAKASGVCVIATGRGSTKAAQAKELGADFAIDTSSGQFADAVQALGGADVILDMVGASYFAQNLASLRTGGRLVCIATQGGKLAELPISLLMQKRAVITGSTLRSRSVEEKARLAREVEARIWPLLESGLVRPFIHKVFPLASANLAHEELEQGGHLGKVVLRI